MPIRIGVLENLKTIDFAVQSSLNENCPNKVNLIKNLERNRIDFEDRGLVIRVPFSAFKYIDEFESVAFEGFTESEYNPANLNPEGNDGKFAYLKQIPMKVQTHEKVAPVLQRMVTATGHERRTIKAINETLKMSSKAIIEYHFKEQAQHTSGPGGGTSK